jgi:hypothetical protein
MQQQALPSPSEVAPAQNNSRPLYFSLRMPRIIIRLEPLSIIRMCSRLNILPLSKDDWMSEQLFLKCFGA